jgi:hypothetical protein
MNIDNIRKYIVIVNGGSGCIFQPEDNAYSYVLTAKHNITNKENQITDLTRFAFQNGTWISMPVKKFDDTDCYFPHSEKDIAIIKIAKINGLDEILRLDNFENDTEYSLCGYPETRRNANQSNKLQWYRKDDNVTIQGTNNNQLREGQVPGNPTREEMIGFSGGAIVKVKDHHLLLVGIQNKMVDAQNEQLGRIEFTPLASFDEIVNQYPEALSPLSPPHCKSFEYLKEQIMKLDGCFQQENIEYTRLCLRNITDEIIENPLTPNVIRNRLNNRMLIYNEGDVSLFHKGLWVAWLEFLIVLKVIGENPKTEQELDNIFNKYRIIYSSSKEDWGNLFKDRILYSDYKGLKENACIIIANEALPQKTIVKKGMISNIARYIPKKQMKIDDGVNNPFESFTHIHIHAFQKDCIIDKEEEYSHFDNTNEKELLNKLKDEYENIINNN